MENYGPVLFWAGYNGSMKYKARFNVIGANKETGAGVEYKQGEVYEEKDIVKGMDMNDFEPVDRTEIVETNPDEPEEKVNLKGMNHKELTAYALEYTNIDPEEYTSKKDLLKAIEESQA